MTIKSMRKNISIPIIKYEEWENFATSIGQDFSGLVFLSIEEFIKNKKKELNLQSGTADILQLKQSLESKIDTQMKEFSDLLHKTVPVIEIAENEKDRIKTQIITLLEDHPKGIEPKKLAAYVGQTRKISNSMIEEMLQLDIIEVNKGLVFLKK